MKCPCCGSRQFQTVAAKRICSYCRSEQDSEPVSGGMVDNWRANQSALIAERFIYHFGMATLRPEKLVRIKTVTP